MSFDPHPVYKALADTGKGAVTFDGYVGVAPEDRLRLHPVLGDASYVEVAMADVIHHEEIEPGRARVLVPACATVRRVTIQETCGHAGDPPPDVLEARPSPATCAKVLDLLVRVQKILEMVINRRTSIDPHSKFGKKLIGDLEAIEGLLASIDARC